ncbi:Mpo1 family 2-hydroxy fatty acid dioxygenase [Cesiribacter andamanensis]|uniref:DUF962 domain-containing protein n=1 Tax=Cesiribacter andamanensis AMV16 TaxID=1279009 RepID=M7NPT9_9BACT|nr:Mpo1-like protein [Cesiribacter andamanensis]EMR03730.1 hypothetical protein ADICEAN_01164 [Cesiribacter andamanensis AMV16]
MRKIDALLSEYGQSHQNATNKTIHWICVPLIFFSLVCLLWSIPAGPPAGEAGPLADLFSGPLAPFANWATLLLLITLMYYLALSPPLFVGMLLFSVLCLLGAWGLERSGIAPLWLIALLIFVVAWIGQFWGHKIEGKKPSFLKDVQFLLIGPAWLMHFLFKKAGIGY